MSRREPRARPKPQRWALAGVLIVLGGALGYLIAATPVRVTVDPPNAGVDFQGGWPEIGFGGSYLLRPGKYTVVASHAGYETTKQAVQVGSARNQEIRITLAKLPGRVTVDTQGVAATLTIIAEGEETDADVSVVTSVPATRLTPSKPDSTGPLSKSAQKRGEGTTDAQKLPAASRPPAPRRRARGPPPGRVRSGP